ncbi:MAG: methyltransferase domain-containing protein [Candidatus Vogelbacteria bacterium]|nr:methyltransferase domain-containing protein [Candidatus Vogelbacteria bacterium]
MDYNFFSEQFKGYKSKSTTDQVLGYDKVLALMGDLKGKKILDYGCGSGEFSEQLAERGGEVMGADLSPDMIEIAIKKSAGKINYVVVKNNQLFLLVLVPVKLSAASSKFFLQEKCQAFCATGRQTAMARKQFWSQN